MTDVWMNGYVDELTNGSGRNGHKPEGKTSKPHKPTDDELRDRWYKGDPDVSYGLGEWKRFSSEQGIWAPIEELEVKKGVARAVEAAKPDGIRPSASLLSSVTELARVKVAVPDRWWNADPDVLVCQNGALSVSRRKLSPHSPANYATSAVPYAYDPDAVANTWRYFIANTVPEAEGFLQEFAGYALTTDTSHELAVWLYGPPGSGKSTFLAGLQTMLGARAGLLGLAEIERSRFALGNVSGKTLLVSTEQPSGYLAAGHILNALISGEPMEIERKYRDSYNIVPQAKIAWAMNETPRVSDASSGLFRRVKVVEFPELLPLERDPQVKVSIATEGAGILNWALEGLARLHEREYFEVPQCVQDSTDEFQRTNDVAALFVEEACIVGHEFRAEPSRLYDAYREWADDNGYAKKNSTNIAADWKRLGFRKGKVMGKRYWNGVGLRIDYPIS